MELKSLAKDTAIYGLSSIVGRFLNYLLVPLYTNVIPASTGGYGIVSNVYAFTALMLVFLTFGMETGFFRFANRQDEDPRRVYANALLFVGGLSLLFVIVCLAGLGPLSDALEYADHPEFVGMMVVVVALDSFQCIPFAYLRYKKRPIKFAAIKLFSIVGNIALNLFFLVLCPWLMRTAPGTVDWFYDPDYVVGYIFLSNLICSAVQMFFFIPELRGFSYRVDRALMRRMVSYSFPLLILGLVGVLNMTVDKMIYPFLYDDRQEGMKQLGIYSATSKVAMVMAMFTQAFRYAYEPFVFGKSNDSDSRETYAKGRDGLHGHPALPRRPRLLGRAFGGRHRHGRRDSQGHLHEPLVLVQADRRDALGRLLLAHRLRGHRGAERVARAALRLPRLRLGIGGRLRRHHPAVLLHRPAEVPHPLRRAWHGCLPAAGCGALRRLDIYRAPGASFCPPPLA